MVEENGVLVAGDHLKERLQQFTELQHPSIPSFDVLEWKVPVDSSEFSPSDWVQLASDIGR